MENMDVTASKKAKTKKSIGGFPFLFLLYGVRWQPVEQFPETPGPNLGLAAGTRPTGFPWKSEPL
jgi:hypothetical protein